MIVAHRINSIEELIKIDKKHGVEIDLRDHFNDLILSHDPFNNGDSCTFNHFLKYYEHSFLILNIKSEGIEFKVLETLKKYNIKKYFFLDSSFPMIYKLINLGEKNIAVRFSEYEDIKTVLNLKDKVKWVWVDCFSYLPLTTFVNTQLRHFKFKICLVSPELQGQDEKIEQYRDFLIENDIKVDMVCTKEYNIEKWENIFK